MEMLEIIKSRHSVRQYKEQAIESSKRAQIKRLLFAMNQAKAASCLMK